MNTSFAVTLLTGFIELILLHQGTVSAPVSKGFVATDILIPASWTKVRSPQE